MRIKDEKDFWSGVMFVGAGLFFAIFAQEYGMGTAQRMGPAYFPTVLGILLIVLGVIIAIKGLAAETEDGKIEPFQFGPLLWVLGAVATFGLLLRPAGMVVALIALVVISSMGSHEFKWKEVIPLTIGLGVLVMVVFIWGLGLTIPVWPAFMNR